MRWYALGTMAAVGAMLLAEMLDVRQWIWLFKPLASTGFIAAALACGAARSRYGRWVLLALCFSWLGDVFLIPRTEGLFLAGLVAFLLGHLAFSAGFLSRGVAPPWVAAALCALAPIAVLIARWLMPHVPLEMRVPVLCYMTVLTAMVALAAGTWGAKGGAAIVLAAAAFFVSDLSVAREAFVERDFLNRIWGLPLYYGAQLVFAWTVKRG